MIVCYICLVRFPCKLGTRHIKRDLINSVLFTKFILELIIIIEVSIDLTDLISGSKTRSVNTTNRSLNNRSICLDNTDIVDLLDNRPFLKLNILVEDKFLNSIDLLVTSISNIVFRQYNRIDNQFSTQRSRNSRSFSFVSVSILCKGISARSKSRDYIRVVKNLQTRRTNRPNSDNWVRKGININTTTTSINIFETQVLAASSGARRSVCTSLRVQTVKLDQFKAAVSCSDSILSSRHLQRCTAVNCLRIYDKIVNMSFESVTDQRTALRGTNSKVIHYNIVDSDRSSDLNTIKVTRVDI